MTVKLPTWSDFRTIACKQEQHLDNPCRKREIRYSARRLCAFILDDLAMSTLPEKIGGIVSTNLSVLNRGYAFTGNCMTHFECTEGDSVVIRAEVIDKQAPKDVNLYYRSAKYKNWYHKVP